MLHNRLALTRYSSKMSSLNVDYNTEHLQRFSEREQSVDLSSCLLKLVPGAANSSAQLDDI
jgi:hypothetical protein